MSVTLKDSVKSFPTEPGVYIMKDFDGVVIYVGKAKDLRARVRSYFATGDGRIQVQYLMKRVSTIDTVVTESEEEALLLERDLIHRHKPRYNIRLKDDKAYLSVRIDRRRPWPRLEVVRQIIPDGADYYGPFASTTKFRDVMQVIRKVVPLRTCSDAVLYNRTRPCLEYEIKQCAGPCCLPVDRAQYAEWLHHATQILEGNLSETLEKLEVQMLQCSEELRFEEAAALRDRITALEAYRDSDKRGITYNFTCDVFALHREAERAIVAVMKTRDGALSEVESYPFSELVVDDGELLESFILQFYSLGKELPAELVVPFELPSQRALIAALSQGEGEIRRESAPLEIVVPSQGPKQRLLRICEVNARQQFGIKFFSEARYDAVAVELQSAFSLSQAPRRVECVDISNFQGSSIVGAITCFGDGVPERRNYRKYNISFQGKPNDFQAIFEVVHRRLCRDPLPELLVIDGGKEQLKRAIEARDEAGVSVDIIALAKMKTRGVDLNQPTEVSHKPERVFIEGAPDAIPLDAASGATKFLQRVRDETHRFVITFHRNKRSKSSMQSFLDQVPGVTPEAKMRLLRAFGSAEAVARKTPEEVARIGRFPKKLGEKLVRLLASQVKKVGQ